MRIGQLFLFTIILVFQVCFEANGERAVTMCTSYIFYSTSSYVRFVQNKDTKNNTEVVVGRSRRMFDEK